MPSDCHKKAIESVSQNNRLDILLNNKINVVQLARRLIKHIECTPRSSSKQSTLKSSKCSPRASNSFQLGTFCIRATP